MPDMPNPNPFSIVFTALWDLLLSHPAFSRDVANGNLIRFDSTTDRNPKKETLSTADLPQVTLIGETLTANLQNTSSTSMTTRRYSWLVQTGDYRYTEFLARVEWYIFAAMTNWKTRLAALQWKDQAFVKRVNIIQAMSGLNQAQDRQNMAGWAAVWTLEVEMHFRTQDLLDELIGPLANTN